MHPDGSTSSLFAFHLGPIQQGFLRITGICCNALRSLFAFYRQKASLILSLMGRCSQLEEFKKTTPFTAPEAWPLKCPSYSNLTKLTVSHLFQVFERGRKSSWRPELFKKLSIYKQGNGDDCRLRFQYLLWITAQPHYVYYY